MSPTIEIEALFESLLIDSHEGISVQIFDFMGEYIQASLSDDNVVQMEFEGEFLDIVCKVNSEYEEFVTYDKGKKVLRVLILKMIYGMIESDFLWYNLFSKKISDLGIKIKPYEQWISNKVIYEHQCTIIWFVDDNKVSHMEESVNSMISDKIE